MADPTPNSNQNEKQPAEQSASNPTESSETVPPTADNPSDQLRSAITNDPEAQKKLAELLSHLQLQSPIGSETSKEHKFWKTQPVPQHGEKITSEGAIEPKRNHEELRKEPYPLPTNFKWCLLDINQKEEMDELYQLLADNYVEDDDAMFRFDYSPAFLDWALKPPGWVEDWHLGVRVAGNNKLVAFISGIPVDLRIRKDTQRIVEINFLCVHKKLRSKRLAPVLIKEITRRVHLTGIFRAVYTAGTVLPRPTATCRYFHRTLNCKKLVDIGFSHLPRDMSMKRMQLRLSLPKETGIRGLRLMREEDITKVQALLNRYMKRMEFSVVFKTPDEVRHWLLPRDGVVWTYVVETPEGTITDVASYYSIPSTVIGHAHHKSMNAAYQFYYASDVVFQEEGEQLLGDRLRGLFKDLLIKAKEIIEELKFGPGDGNLNYYLYNWRCHDVPPNKVGLIML
ncbi:glycylpeptide N-tetradecanoyltransferase 1 [Syncephalis fuscata]|nr:glycylpeptide N-tetradecanoyltransferase 1 [Syncephalis fuscata]